MFTSSMNKHREGNCLEKLGEYVSLGVVITVCWIFLNIIVAIKYAIDDNIDRKV